MSTNKHINLTLNEVGDGGEGAQGGRPLEGNKI